MPTKLSSLISSLPIISTNPSLVISLERDIVYVNPKETSLEEEPSSFEEIVLIGTLLLTLPVKRKVKSLKVVLQGITDAYAGYGTEYQTSVCLNEQVELVLKETLEAGSHAFKFLFLIPENTSTFERSTFGRVRHSVKGFVEFSGKLTKDISSSSTAIWITLGAGTADIPEALNSVIEVESEILGPIMATFSSPHLSVASLLQLDVHLVSPKLDDVTILSVEGYINQDFKISYDNGSIINTIPKRFPLETVLPLPSSTTSQFVTKLYQNVPWDHSQTMRLPSEDVLRPSTLISTETRIRVSHKLILAFRYRVGEEGEDKLLVLKKSVMISSCGCLLDSLLLPEYSKLPPVLSCNSLVSSNVGGRNQIQNLTPRHQGRLNRCRCDLTLEEILLDLETTSGGGLLNHGSMRLPITAEPNRSSSEEESFSMRGSSRRSEKSAGIPPLLMRTPPSLGDVRSRERETIEMVDERS